VESFFFPFFWGTLRDQIFLFFQKDFSGGKSSFFFRVSVRGRVPHRGSSSQRNRFPLTHPSTCHISIPTHDGPIEKPLCFYSISPPPLGEIMLPSPSGFYSSCKGNAASPFQKGRKLLGEKTLGLRGVPTHGFLFLGGFPF